MRILKTFKKGNYRVHVVDHVLEGDEEERRVMVETGSGYTDWPVEYEDGEIRFDRPELLSVAVKNILTPRAFRWLKNH